ncbi:UPF0481 protein [Hordeum vulgare]|uniref:Uncharacterized protein n=2 Tax=Hordeum vulgare subsp. vulgare TaxID=112509 RepID=A0A8I7BJL9_HORVV|nr:UPF0481 protein At3g47200-like [Hordeum vulgare subsp. vulgare]KAE8785656.1 UPF0481 protein [Hordeum vulgare]KAI4971457.1 hypothetical protein ZWY2020_002371 [Hordeum vulgare]
MGEATLGPNKVEYPTVEAADAALALTPSPGGGGGRSWVVEMEKTIGDMNIDPAVEMARWKRHSVYRVPERIKNLHNSKAYQPELVSLGPFHHGDPELLPMEEHKRRAVVHLVKRSGKPLREFVAAVAEVATQLLDAYKDLGEEWRGVDNRERFVELMVTDGCFLVEAMRMDALRGKVHEDYAPNDPVFSKYGYLYLWNYIQSDMVVVENQLPLLLLQRLLVVMDHDRYQNASGVSRLVLDSLCPWRRHLVGINHLGLHPLDILYTSLTHGDHQERTGSTAYVMPSAMEIYEAGIHFRVSDTDSLLDVHFEHGVLSMPAIRVDDRTEKKFLNLMAFERLHPGAGNDVTAYVIFMDNIISSAKDVALLRSKNIIECGLGSDEEVAKLLNNTLNKGGVMSPSSRLHDVQRRVKAHCRMRWNRWRANFFQRYLRNPWVFISLVAAVVLLVATLLQTVYTVLPFYTNK